MAKHTIYSNYNLSQTTHMDELLELSSIRDLETMLKKALGIVSRIFEAEAGLIIFQAQSRLRLQSGLFRPEVAATVEHWEESVSQRLQNKSWHIANLDSLPISVQKMEESELMLVSFPLLHSQTVAGTVSLVVCDKLTPEQNRLLNRVAISISHITALVVDMQIKQQHINQMEIFHKLGQALMKTFDVNRLLLDIMELAANALEAGAASIMLIDEEHSELVFKVSHGDHSNMLRQQRIPLDEGIAGWVACNGRPVIANKARTDPRFSHRVDVRTGFLTQSIAAVPLKIKGRIIGVLETLNKYSGEGFNDEDIRLMSSIAAQSAIAIDNARLYQQVRHERDYVIQAQENIRKELARNLHDGPIQLLAAISMSLDHLERLNRLKPEAVQDEIGLLRNLAHKATTEARTVLFELRPLILETQGLVVAVEQYVNQLRNNESFTVQFKTIAKVDYNTKIAGTIFSIIQEAINNIKRHAKAQGVWLSLDIKDNRFIVTIRDNGQGFDIDKLAKGYDRRGSLGLLNMKERAELIEAEFHIESCTESPNRGTIVQLIMPLPSGVSKKTKK